MSPDSAKWLEAMKSEMRSMYENKVWTLIDFPMISESLRLNRSSRGRRMLIVVLLSTKIELSQNVFDKFKVLTTMRFSHSYLCLSLSESC